MFINGSGQNEQYLWRTVHTCLLLGVGALVQAVSEDKIFFFKSAKQKQEELPLAAIFVMGSRRNKQSLKIILHRCFGTFSNAVSEEKIRTPSDVNSLHCLWQGELKEVLLKIILNRNKGFCCS